jgi:5-carboxymethyl-2-hydroxymuconate isomerase
MPHLTIEITNNIELDQHRLLTNANAALLASGEFNEPDIKARCIVLHTFRQGTQERRDGFIHATLSILSGRTDEVKTALAETVRDVIAAEVKTDACGIGIQISVDVRDMQRAIYGKAVLPA